MKIRVFIAVEVECTHEMRRFMGAVQEENLPIRMVKPDNIHITLRFLGDISSEQVEAITRAVEGAVEGVPPFEIRLKGVGVFPKMSNPRVVWIGLQNVEPLAKMVKDLEGPLNDLGFRPDRKGFKPHVTVGRVKKRKGIDRLKALVDAFSKVEFSQQVVTAVALKKSQLTPHGPIYSDLSRTDLE